MYFVYIIECRDGSLYTGITTNVQRRLKEHKEGKGGRYTRAKKVKKLLYFEKSKNRSSASKREAEIKCLPKSKKLLLVSS